MTEYLDFVNLMSYDMHGSWESETGHQETFLKRASDAIRSSCIYVLFAFC